MAKVCYTYLMNTEVRAMIETKAMAYVNMYGVLGTLENLCQLDGEAQAILAQLKKPVSLCFSVKDGPCCTFHAEAK